MSRKMPIRFESALFAAVVLLHASNLAAQPGRAVLTGSVVVDSLPLPGVEVLLPEHSLQAFTNDSGRFRLSGIPSGSHEIQVRHIGYAPVFLDVVIAPNDSLDRRIVLARVPTLESVDVQASTVLPSFEEHRRMGLGKFLTREDLAKQENRKMSEIVAQFRGIRIYHGMSGRAFIYSGRRPITSITGRRRGAPGERAEGPIDACYAQIFVNEVVVYRGLENEPLFDINSIPPSSIEAIEYYSGPASTPMRYSRLNSQCGVVAIHTRRTP